jgi:aspartokinase/homoserine dehydrogenase 1
VVPLSVGAQSCVAGFSTIDGMALLNVEGTGMIGVSGITERIFSVLASMNLTVQLIAQVPSHGV